MGEENERLNQFFNDQYALDISIYDQSFLEKVIKSCVVASSNITIQNYLSFLVSTADEKNFLTGLPEIKSFALLVRYSPKK
jgi:hypothetical protein